MEHDEEDNYYENENQNESYKAKNDQLNNSQKNNGNLGKSNVHNEGENNEEHEQEHENEQEQEQIDTAPLLFVDVNLGQGKSERITIHEGDRAEDLAKRFCDEHSKVID